MTFLRINGWKIPATIGRATEVTMAHGELGPTWTGRPNRKRVALPRMWQATAFPMTQAEADQLEALIQGRGHSWEFARDPFSFSGIGLETADTPLIVLDSEVPGIPGRFGDDGAAFTFDCGIRECWTVSYVWDATEEDGFHVWKTVRSDGAKWENGVRNDALDTSELTVSPPAIAFDTFSGPPYYMSNLVVLPYEALDEFIEENYLWQTGHEQSFRAPLAENADVRETAGASLGTFTGTILDDGRVVNERGEIGSAEFNGTDIATYGTNSATRSSAEPEMSWEWWGYVDSGLAGASPGYAMARSDGAFTSGYLVGHLGVFSGLYSWGMLFARTAAGFPATTTNVAEVPVDTWQHFAVTWTESDGTFRLYRNGQLETNVTTAVSVSPLANDSALVFGIGNDPSDLLDPWNGRIQEAKVYKRALTLEQIRERYEAGLRYNRSYPGPRPNSRLPRLELFGDCVEGEVVEVLGEMRQAQGVIQHAPKQTTGGAGGWANNNRSVPFELVDVRPRGRDVISPMPTVAYLFDERYRNSAGTQIETAIGVQPNGTITGTQDYAPGPFGFGRSRDMANAVGFRYDLGPAINNLLDGEERVSLLAWVLLDAFSAQDTIVDFERATAGITRLQLSANNGVVRMGGRSSAADGFTFHGAGIIPTQRWSLVGGTIDLNDPVFKNTVAGGDAAIRTFVWDDQDGLQYSTLADATFTRNDFDPADSDPASNVQVGVDQSLTDPWNGNLAGLYIFPGVALTRADVTRFGEFGRRGTLR